MSKFTKGEMSIKQTPKLQQPCRTVILKNIPGKKCAVSSGSWLVTHSITHTPLIIVGCLVTSPHSTPACNIIIMFAVHVMYFGLIPLSSYLGTLVITTSYSLNEGRPLYKV
jgi:hypothetical protein